MIQDSPLKATPWWDWGDLLDEDERWRRVQPREERRSDTRRLAKKQWFAR